MLKPPIARMGGKSKLRKKIIEMIPEHVCYVEPFFGVGWVYFGKEISIVEVINDIDGELVNLFKMIKLHAPEIQRLMTYEVSSRDMFEKHKYEDVNNLTELQRAVRFIYIISQSFGSKGGVYGYGTNSKPSPQIFNTEKLLELKERLRNTYIENLSFEKIFQKYDRDYTMFFCDPPYLETAGYGYSFGEEQHIMLSDILKNIKGKFILTINDHEKLRNLYKGFNIKEEKVAYSIAKNQESRREYDELIITNF